MAKVEVPLTINHFMNICNEPPVMQSIIKSLAKFLSILNWNKTHEVLELYNLYIHV